MLQTFTAQLRNDGLVFVASEAAARAWRSCLTLRGQILPALGSGSTWDALQEGRGPEMLDHRCWVGKDLTGAVAPQSSVRGEDGVSLRKPQGSLSPVDGGVVPSMQPSPTSLDLTIACAVMCRTPLLSSVSCSQDPRRFCLSGSPASWKNI